MSEFASVDEALDFAIAREKDAYNFYIQLSGWTRNPKTQKMLEDFALEEWRHRIRLEAVKTDEIVLGDNEICSVDISESVEKVKPNENMTYADLLKLGIEKEKYAYRLYTNLADLAENEELRNMFTKLAQEEAVHKLRLELEYDMQAC